MGAYPEYPGLGQQLSSGQEGTVDLLTDRRPRGPGQHLHGRVPKGITGKYRLTAEDMLDARKGDDAIARRPYPLDI
jgi:hypothetical protein